MWLLLSLPPLYILLTDAGFALTQPAMFSQFDLSDFLNLTPFPVHRNQSHCEANPSCASPNCLTTPLDGCNETRLQAGKHFGRLRRTGEASKQRGGCAPAAEICRERVSCKIRARRQTLPVHPWSGRIIRNREISCSKAFPNLEMQVAKSVYLYKICAHQPHP